MSRLFSELELIARYPFKESLPGLVDVGAHEGGVTAAFANKGWKVIAFEPEEENRNVFLKRTSQFDSQIICIPKAVTDQSGEKIPFYTSSTHFGIHSIKPFHETHSESYEVETITLKDSLEEKGFTDVTFLKVDTEGADFLALKGFDWNRYQPEVVMVEFMDDRSGQNFGYTHHDMADFMNDKGYTCFVSEWAPIKSYGIKGVSQDPHQWLRCATYPLSGELAWGNLIFVPNKDAEKFQKHLDDYLDSLRTKRPKEEVQLKPSPVRSFVKAIPGIYPLYKYIRNR